MGLLTIFLASSLLSRHGDGRSGDPEDPEKLRRDVEFATDGDDDSEQKNRGLEPNDHVEDDDDESDSDPQGDGEDEPEEPSRPGRRVAFDSPSVESSPPSEEGDPQPGFLTRLKTIVFPPRDEEDHLSMPNYRTLPIISGLIIPFSILLEIPGLTDDWYIRTNGNTVVESRPNPVLLHVGLGFSMFFAVLANVSLILRFLDKAPVLVTTSITIASLTIHGNASLQRFAVDCVLLFTDLINITVVVTFGVLHRFNDGFTYAQGYWMTGIYASYLSSSPHSPIVSVCSTIVSTITNLILIWDLFLTRDFAHSGMGTQSDPASWHALTFRDRQRSESQAAIAFDHRHAPLGIHRARGPNQFVFDWSQLH